MSRNNLHPESWMNRSDILKWDGWGFSDSQFVLQDDGNVGFTGSRYEHSGSTMFGFRTWIQNRLGIDMSLRADNKNSIDSIEVPVTRISADFLEDLKSAGVLYSTESKERLVRSHGQTVEEIWTLRYESCPRCPDVVLWPSSNANVETIVQLARKHNVVLIPYGGGTNVTLALTCSDQETRPIASVDMCKMCNILWMDETNLTAHIEAGKVGKDIEHELNSRGYTIGHEPDSIELSTLGGWISTRASGMKKNIYGNIEDLVVHITMVTPRGVMQKSCMGPRISAGPDLHHIMMGSEGMFGLITSAIVKIRPLPECKHYGSIVFPDFESGVKCLREIARRRCAPASIRLMDNEQFMLGQALKPGQSGWFGSIEMIFKKIYLQSVCGFNLRRMCAATLLFEGTSKDVSMQERQVYKCAKEFGGVASSEENGRIGYLLTFMIAYLRDIGIEYNILAESFETSVPWDKVLDLCRNTIQTIKAECAKHGIKHLMATCRVTQTYDVGACVYFYFAFNRTGIENAIHVYESIESAARDEILACGGNISHHHGVGKIRRKWLLDTIGPIGIGVLQALKQYLDPQNIFALDNLVDFPAAAEGMKVEEVMKVKL